MLQSRNVHDVDLEALRFFSSLRDAQVFLKGPLRVFLWLGASTSNDQLPGHTLFDLTLS